MSFFRKKREPAKPEKKNHSWLHRGIFVDIRDKSNPQNRGWGWKLVSETDRFLIELATCSCGEVVYEAPPVRLQFGKKLAPLVYDEAAAKAAHLRHRVEMLER